VGSLNLVPSGEPPAELLGPMRLADAGPCELGDFDCGEPSINEWLWRRARASDGDTARTHVVLDHDRRVVAYCALSAAAIPHAEATAKLRRNRPDPIPAILIGRLGVTRAWQGRGLATDLTGYAMRRIAAVAESVGVAYVIVQPLDSRLRGFYHRLGFRAFGPGDTPPMLIPAAQVRKLFGSP
jgi:GNAT superfamily N-acetyltransferase